MGVDGSGSEAVVELEDVRVQSGGGVGDPDSSSIGETILNDLRSVFRAAVEGEQGRSTLDASELVDDTTASA